MFAWLKPDKMDEFFAQDFDQQYMQAVPYHSRSDFDRKHKSAYRNMKYLREAYESTLRYPGGGRFRVVQDSTLEHNYWIVKVGNSTAFVANPLEYFNLRERTDFADTDIALLQARASGEPETGLTVAPVGVSMSSLREEQQEAMARIKEAENEMEAIRKGTHTAMAEVVKQMEEAKQALQAKEEELREIVAVQKAELEKMLTECKQKVFKMESLIFNIQSYLGETYEVYHLRQGRPAPPSTPLVIGQKLRFLDEDLPMLVGLYGNNLIGGDQEDYQSFLDALKYSDMLVDYLTLSERSITCFRLSRHITMKLGHRAQTATDKLGVISHWIESIEGPYGNDAMGFIINDGDNLFVTMVDDADKLFVSDDLFLDINGPEMQQSTDPRHALARRFMFSTIQGFIDCKKMLTFSEEASIFKMTHNIILSAATTRLQDTRFGTFMDLKMKLNAMTRANDDVYVIDINNDPSRVWGYVPDKSNNSSDKGLTKINTVRYRDGMKATFVSVERDTWSDGDSRVNFQIVENEYINVTYLNSVWVNYFIVNKMTDSSSRGGNPFGLFVKDLLEIRDFLNKREAKELALIKKEYPEFESVPDWPLRLSEWKLQQKVPVREITEYQAKRFAKALQEGNVQKLDFLYVPGPLPVIVPREKLDYASNMAEIDRNRKNYVNIEQRSHLFYSDKELESIDWTSHFSKKYRDRLMEIDCRNFHAAQQAIEALEKQFGMALMHRVKALQNLIELFGDVDYMQNEHYDASKIIKMLEEDDALVRRHALHKPVESDLFHFSNYPPADKEKSIRQRELWEQDAECWVARIVIGDRYCDQIRKYRKDRNLPILMDNVTNLMVTAYLSIVDQLNSYPYTHLQGGKDE